MEVFAEPPLRLCEDTGALTYVQDEVTAFLSSYLTLSVLAALAVALWTQTMERYVLPPIGRRFLPRESWADPFIRTRFIHHSVLFFHHVFACLVGVGIIATFYTCWTEDHFRCNSQCEPKDIRMWFNRSINGQQVIAFLYIYQLGHYLYGFVDLLLLKERKRDFWTMLVHHITTVFLISISVLTCLQKSGVGILVFFDVADIFIMVINVAKCTRDQDGFTVKAAYILLVLTFGIPRLVLLPYHLPRHILYGGPHLPYEEWLWAMLGILTLCNLLWFWRILKIGWDALNGKEIDDTRLVVEEQQGQKPHSS